MTLTAPPPQIRFEEPTIQLLGRTLPRASGPERVAWAIIFLGLVFVLSLSRHLTPDPRGHGTHQQIPWIAGPDHTLPPCGFIVWTKQLTGKGYPCPSCGFTTTFALAAHGRPVDAFLNQPFGFIVFLIFALLVPVSLLCAIGQVSPLRATDHWRWRWILLSLAALWLLGWYYKVRIFTE